MKKGAFFTLLLMLSTFVLSAQNLSVTTATHTYSYSQELKNDVDSKNYHYNDVPPGYSVCGVEQLGLTWSGTFNSHFKYYLLPTEDMDRIEYIYSDDNYEVGSKINNRTILARTSCYNLPYAPRPSSGGSQADRSYYFSPVGDTYVDTEFYSTAGSNAGYFGPSVSERKPNGYYMNKYCVEKDDNNQFCTINEGEYFFHQNSQYGYETMYDAGGGAFTKENVDCTSANAEFIWIVTKGNQGGYYICNKKSGLYLTSEISSLSSRSLALKNTPEEFFFSIYTHYDGYKGCYMIQSKAMIANNECLDAAGDNNEVISFSIDGENGTSAWELSSYTGWSYDSSTKTLYINSNSAMIDFYEKESRPWHNIASQILHIVISDKVTNISRFAFANCIAVEEITIPGSILTVGEDAFLDCTALTAVHIKNLSAWCNIDFSNMNSNPTNFAHNLYLNNELITNLVIPRDVTVIKTQAFRGCSCFKTATIHDGVISIGEYSFNTCTNMTSVQLPQNITSIPRGMFSGCNNLSDVTIPESVTNISYSSFWGCNLNKIIIPSNVVSIGEIAFYNCRNLKEVINFSNLDIVAGENSHGGVALYAERVHSSRLYDDVEFVYDYIKDFTTLYYIRTFENIDWQPWYMPFDVELSDVENELEVARLNNIREYDDNNDGEIDRTELEVIRLASGTLQANYPYIVKAKVPGEKKFVFENVTVEPFENNSYDCSSFTTKFTFTGSNSAMAYNSSYYGLENNCLVSPVSIYAYVGKEVVSESELSNDKVYALRSGRTFLLYSSNEEVAGKLCSGNGGAVGIVNRDINDVNQHFKIENINGNYYLYSVGAGKYVNSAGQYVDTPTDALKIEKIAGEYQWKLGVGSKYLNSQVSGQTREGMIVDSWSTTDEGNSYIIEELVPSLAPNRWYLSVEARSPMFKAPAQIRLFIRGEEKDNTTAIESVEEVAEEEVVVYDLSGRRVENPTEGIYIVNGKKTFIK